MGSLRRLAAHASRWPVRSNALIVVVIGVLLTSISTYLNVPENPLHIVQKLCAQTIQLLEAATELP